MRKLIIFALCLALVLCGCSMSAPYYEQELEGLETKTRYNYYFPDDQRVTGIWENNTGKQLYYYPEFKLERLRGEDWHTVSPKTEPEFNLSAKTVIPVGESSSALYPLDGYTLEDEAKYRISTYCFDDEENYYQVYIPFECNFEKAQEEVVGIMGSAAAAQN